MASGGEGRTPQERDVLPPSEAGVCIRCREPRRVRTILRVDAAHGLRASLVTVTSCACGTVECDAE